MVEHTPIKSGRRWLVIITLVIGSLILFCSLLPSIISTQWAKDRVLGLAAPHIPGEMRVESWSLSWLSEQKLDGITYADPQTGMQMDAARLTLGKGLFSLLLDQGNMGTVKLSRPAIQVTLPDSAQKDGKPGQASQPGKEPPQDTPPDSLPSPAPGAPTRVLPPISGLLLVEQGSIAVARTGAASETVAEDITMQIEVISASDPITYTLSLASPDGAGMVSGQGKIMLDTAGTEILAIQPSGELRITGWKISRLLDLATAYADLPTGDGILDSTIAFSGELSQGINLEGKIDLTKLALSGGPLAADRPSIDKLSMEFSAVKNIKRVELTSLKLASPLLSGSLAATIDTGGAVQFKSALRIDLPEVSRQFPHNLRLQEELQITGGILELQADAGLNQGESRFTANASVEGLAGVREGKQISLAEPFTFDLAGQLVKNELSLERFAVKSSFLNGQGRGTLNDLKINLEADLKTALKEISKFISLQDYQATGHLDLSVEANRRDEKTVGLSVRLGAEKLLVKQGTTILIPENPLNLETDATLLISQDFSFSGASEVKLSYLAWLGKGSITGTEILLDAGWKLKKLGALVTDAQINLGDLGVMLQSLKTLPTAFTPGGNSRFKVKISGGDNRFLVEDLVLESPKLSLRRDKVDLIPASTLKLAAAGAVLLGSDGSVTLVENPTLRYESWLGSGSLQAVALELPARQLNALVFDGKTDLLKLTALLRGLDILPPELSFSGAGTTSLAMDYSPEQSKLASLRTEIDDFVLKQGDKTYQDKRLVVDTAGTIEMAKRRAALSPVQLDSANGTISFERITVGDWNDPLDTLDSSGQARFDLATVFSALTDWFSLPPDISAAATLDLNWNADARSDTEHGYRFNADLSNVNLAKAELKAFSDEQVVLKMNGTRNPSTGQLTLEQVALSSQPLTFNAAGYWNTDAGERTELDLKGDLSMDLARIAELVRTFTELDLEMTGKSERPFDLGIKVNDEQREKWWQHTVFNTTFQAEFIRVLGVELRSLEIPISIAQGVGEAEIRGNANQGALLLQPRLDLMSTPPLLTIPDNSRVLDKMQITRDMANQLLARIHPLFKGATQMSGVFDLDLKHFSWPLGRENLNDLRFAGNMDFHDVRLDSSTLLGALLTALRIQETGLDLSGRQILFTCANGRIETNQLRTNLGDTELLIGGSLGLDTTIDYLAQVEVTQKLVGGDLYKYLEGTMIRVPIGGTLSDPDISAKTVQRAVADLANQAGKKKLEEAAGNLLKKLF